MITAKGYQEGLAALRAVRDEIKPLERQLAKVQAELGKLHTARDQKVQELGQFGKAKADRLATSAGLSVIDVVALVPSLSPQEPASAPAESPVTDSTTDDHSGPHEAAQGIKEPAGAPASVPAPSQQPAPTDEVAGSQEACATAEAPVPAARVPAQGGTQERELPSIPAGEEGDRWFRAQPNPRKDSPRSRKDTARPRSPYLASTPPDFKQDVRKAVFLDTTTGVLVGQGGTATLDLGPASVAEILTAVYATVPDDVERIYITDGAPWHRHADRHTWLKDAVAEWLNSPLPEGWKVESSRGRDRMAGHFVHPRHPVGRWQRGSQHTEIRAVDEWFDPAGADPATVRTAFVLLWGALRQYWPDVVLMGSPSPTGRDLWSRTIPTKAGAKWADGYPVLSQEIRGLLHATAGQGRTELITPPRVPERVPGWYEMDRTFAYAKHTWMGAVGVPRRVTAGAFAALAQKEQTNLLYSPSHWQVRVTVPKDWAHVGLLPAPAPGERSWHYPHEGGRTFTTWAGGAEVSLALKNPVGAWRVEVLDGLVWEKGSPLKDWADNLKQAWKSLRAQAELQGDERERQAARLASRAVRSILLYGIGGFAQRPRITTGTIELGADGAAPEIPEGARLTGLTDTHVTWERNRGFADDPYAHPELAAGVWSAARAALLDGPTGTKDPATGKPVRAGALHLPAGSVLAFRTDAIYSSVRPDWPYGGEPGDYLLKGALPWEQMTPTSDAEFYDLQALGRQALEAGEQ